ncbi:MAG: hypothetical protein ABFD79_08710 [Phycisphaerales bacterium]
MGLFNGHQKKIDQGAGSVSNETKAQKREVFRVSFPKNCQPVITNLPAAVLDISVKAVKFEINLEDAKKANLILNSKVKLKIQFADDSVLETSGKIFRLDQTDPSVCVYVCMFSREIPQAIITKQQQYLLKNFPDFCRQAFKF